MAKKRTMLAIVLSLWLSIGAGVQVLLHFPSFVDRPEPFLEDGVVRYDSFLLREEEHYQDGYTLYQNKTSLLKEFVIHRLLHNDEHTYTYLTAFEGWSVYQDDTSYALLQNDDMLVFHTDTSTFDQKRIEKLLQSFTKK